MVTQGMTRWTLASGLVVMITTVRAGAAWADVPTTNATPVEASPGTGHGTPSPAPTRPMPKPLAAKPRAAKAPATPAKTTRTAADKQQLAEIENVAKQVAAFVAVLGQTTLRDDSVLLDMNYPRASSVGRGGGHSVGSHADTGSAVGGDWRNISGPGAAADVVPQGTATCSVGAAQAGVVDVAGIETKITMAYLNSVRRCAKGASAVLVSETKLSFTVDANGRIAALASSGADAEISACIAKHAAQWRFAPPKSASAVATRIDVTLQTKP